MDVKSFSKACGARYAARAALHYKHFVLLLALLLFLFQRKSKRAGEREREREREEEEKEKEKEKEKEEEKEEEQEKEKKRKESLYIKKERSGVVVILDLDGPLLTPPAPDACACPACLPGRS